MLLDILGSAGFGSALGGIFGYLSKREERASIQMTLNHELDMVAAKTDAALQMAEMGIETARVAGELVVEKLEAKAFQLSQTTTSKFAEHLKALIRPAILGILMYQTYTILIALETLTGGLTAFSSDELLGLYRIVVLSTTGLTSTAVGWYFASRTSKQFDTLVRNSK